MTVIKSHVADRLIANHASHCARSYRDDAHSRGPDAGDRTFANGDSHREYLKNLNKVTVDRYANAVLQNYRDGPASVILRCAIGYGMPAD